MSPLALFFPDYHLPSVYELTADWLKEQGYKALILDIDNTLVSPNAPAGQEAQGFKASLEAAGIACMVLSNNAEDRARSFARGLGCPYLAQAKKPSPRGFREALKILGTRASETLVVGDQLLTDVAGAHRAGLKALLVDALDPAHEQPFVRVKRILEKPLLRAWRKSLGEKVWQKTVDKKPEG